MCNNFCGNNGCGFNIWWIIILAVLFCCCGNGNNGALYGGNGCGCNTSTCC